MRLSIAAAIACLSVAGVAAGDRATAAITKFTNIPAEELGPALQTLAQAHDLQVVYLSEAIDKLKTSGAVGQFTAEQALKRLLTGTGLTYRYLDEKTVTVVPIPTGSPISSIGGNANSSGSPNAGSQEGSQLWERFRLAQANQGVAQSSSAIGSDVQSASGSSANSPGLTEIIVTAQKKSERLQDVPVPVSVIDTANLAETGQVLLRDYYSSVPNFNDAPNVNGIQMLVIRGIVTSGLDVPSVGVVIDDVPFGSQSDGSADEIPEIDPGDLARIEVLRGPQGTLYGANSMGGLVKYVTIDPSTDGYSGRIEGGTSSVYNGAEPGYVFRGSANIPVTSDLAVRVSAFDRQDPGYIDDAFLNLKGVNEVQNYGTRLAALWKPSSDFSIKLSALYQDSQSTGVSESDALPGLGTLQQHRIANTGGESRIVQAYSAIVNAHFANVDLVSLTGYNVNNYHDSYDYSSTLGPVAQAVFGVSGAPFLFHLITNKFTQELRLSESIGEHFTWLAGGYYTHEFKPSEITLDASDPTTGQRVGALGSLPLTESYQEYAGFANLTYKVSDQFDIQVGGRESHIDVSGPEIAASGIFASVTPAYNNATDVFTYSVTPRFKITPDIMVYARLSSGFRPGAPNSAYTISLGAPPAQTPDKTKDYEVGAKADFLDNKVAIDASVYYIDWKNIELQLNTPGGFTYGANGGAAKSQGVELSATAIPLKGLTIAGWITYQDAVLTEAFPASSTTLGVPGDRLPFSSRYSGTLSADQEFALGSNTMGFVGAAANYVGDRVGPFGVSEERQIFPSYTKVDLKAGVHYGKWTTNLYANNVGDVRGLLNGGLNYAGPSPLARIYITPRTVGVSVERKF